MSVSSQITEKTYKPGTGSNPQSLSGLVFFDPATIKVQLTVGKTGAKSLLTQDVDYILTGDGATGAASITALADYALDDELRVYRQSPLVQPEEFRNDEGVNLKTLERRLDEQVLVDQEQAREQARSPKVPRGEAPPSFASFAGAAFGALIEYDGSGQLVAKPFEETAVGTAMGTVQEVLALSALLIAQAEGTRVADFAEGVATTPEGEDFYFFADQQIKLYTNGPDVSEDAPLYVSGTAAVPEPPFVPESGQLHIGSIMMADENMEMPLLAKSSQLYVQGSEGDNGLVSPASPMMNAAGSIALLWDFPVEKYNVLNRNPVLFGTTNNPTNRGFALEYVPLGNITNPTHQYWTFGITGSNGTAPQWSCESNRSIPPTVRRIVPFIFIAAGQMQLDVLDVDTGTWYAGAPVAAPAGWAGCERLTYPATIGGHRGSASYSFPVDFNGTGSNTPQQNPSARGSFADVVISDTTLSRADIEAIYLDGASVSETVGAANLRLHCPLASEGQKDLSVVSNQAGLAAATVIEEGTTNAGPTMRPQGANYIVLDGIRYPGAIVLGDETWTARGRASGVSGQAQYRYVTRAGVSQTAWTDCAHTLVGSDLTLEIAPPPAGVTDQCQVQVRFSSDPALVATTHADVQGVAHIALWSQSEGVFATTQGSDTTGATTTDLQPLAANTNTVTFIDTDGNARTSELRPRLIGEGATALANALRDAVQTPVVFAQHQKSGTSRRDLMDDSRTERLWADELAAHLFVLNRAANGAVPLTGHIDLCWEASDNVIPFGRLVLAPWLTGAAYPGETYTYGAIDHYPLDGTFTQAPYYVMPANRATEANASSSTTSDAGSEADQRDSARNWGHLLGYEIGPECTTHGMEGESGGVLPSFPATHPLPGSLEGAAEMGVNTAETTKMILGAGAYRGAVFYEAIRAGSAPNKVIISLGSPRRFPGENLADPDVGYDTTGFTVPTDLALETKAVGGNARWGLEARIGASDAFSLLNVTAAEFIQDANGNVTECEVTLSANYVPGETAIRHRPGTTGSYRDTTVLQTDWRAGQHMFTIGSSRFEVAGSNQELLLAA